MVTNRKDALIAFLKDPAHAGDFNYGVNAFTGGASGGTVYLNVNITTAAFNYSSNLNSLIIHDTQTTLDDVIYYLTQNSYSVLKSYPDSTVLVNYTLNNKEYRNFTGSVPVLNSMIDYLSGVDFSAVQEADVTRTSSDNVPTSMKSFTAGFANHGSSPATTSRTLKQSPATNGGIYVTFKGIEYQLPVDTITNTGQSKESTYLLGYLLAISKYVDTGKLGNVTDTDVVTVINANLNYTSTNTDAKIAYTYNGKSYSFKTDDGLSYVNGFIDGLSGLDVSKAGPIEINRTISTLSFPLVPVKSTVTVATTTTTTVTTTPAVTTTSVGKTTTTGTSPVTNTTSTTVTVPTTSDPTKPPVTTTTTTVSVVKTSNTVPNTFTITNQKLVVIVNQFLTNLKNDIGDISRFAGMGAPLDITFNGTVYSTNVAVVLYLQQYLKTFGDTTITETSITSAITNIVSDTNTTYFLNDKTYLVEVATYRSYNGLVDAFNIVDIGSIVPNTTDSTTPNAVLLFISGNKKSIPNKLNQTPASLAAYADGPAKLTTVNSTISATNPIIPDMSRGVIPTSSRDVQVLSYLEKFAVTA